MNKNDVLSFLLNDINIPKCACQQCNNNVSLHGRKIQFNLFADKCLNKGNFKNPCRLEFYRFNDYNINNAINKIRKIQSKNISDEHRSSLSIANSGNLNPASFKQLSIKYGDKNAIEILKKRAKSGKTNPFYGKKHSNETLIKLAIVRSNIAKIVTRPELAMWGILKGIGYNFEYQHPIGRYVVDFLIGNNIIEVYGDYWHNRDMKSMYNEDKHGKNGIEHDKKREIFLKNSGYKLFIFWESDVFKNTEGIINEIKKNIKNE
jgi:very-short-patch-repair endonuclease